MKPNKDHEICTGIFKNNEINMSMEKPDITPIAGHFWVILFVTVFLMVSIRIGKYQIQNDEPKALSPPPKNLESVMVNFTLMALLSISMITYTFYWKK